MLNTIALKIILLVTHDKPYEEETDRKTISCCFFDWQFIVAPDQLTIVSLFLKAVMYVNCEYHTVLKSIRVTIFDLRHCKFYSI
jgi:hypothetical protein